MTTIPQDERLAADTPFMAFWMAINTELVAQKLPALTFGPALYLWQSTLGEAVASQNRVLFHQLRDAA